MLYHIFQETYLWSLSFAIEYVAESLIFFFFDVLDPHQIAEIIKVL